VDTLRAVERSVVACERCSRLRTYCREVAKTRVKRFRDEDYWGRPVPGFGDGAARLFIVGLAPAAHGGNRTGRVFTGDRSGDFLFAALHRAGFSSSPLSLRRGDGLELTDCYVAPIVRCAPPANRPSPGEILACRDYLEREFAILRDVRAILALGQLAMDGFLALYQTVSPGFAGKRLRFGHGVAHDLGEGRRLFASYHPSQQNTFTGRLTARDMDSVLAAVKKFLGPPGDRGRVTR
jgi:uracil-DNA glycosylase family 4